MLILLRATFGLASDCNLLFKRKFAIERCNIKGDSGYFLQYITNLLRSFKNYPFSVFLFAISKAPIYIVIIRPVLMFSKAVSNYLINL